MTSKGCAFLMDMGTGKTITTIALAGTLHHLSLIHISEPTRH